VPEGSVGFYSRDAHGPDHEVNGVSSLVVAEIKKPGIPIGQPQMAQPWKYVKELGERGCITPSTSVHCFVLGSSIEQGEAEPMERGNTIITPMTYEIFIRRAERRMLNLRDKLRDAPFLKEHGLDVNQFVTPPESPQASLALRRRRTVEQPA
jgi:hypothetical protein